MLPIMPFDGAKVFYWNKAVYIATMGAVLVLLFLFEGNAISITTLLFVLILAYFMSSFYRFII
jgi:Zn-dependent protease